MTALSSVAVPAHADHDRLPAGRTLVSYVVEPGDTVSGLAVRFHAWTAEIASHNHLGPDGALRVGQRIEVPVVGRAGASTQTAMWQHPDPAREKVRRVIAGAARNHGVDPQLALAVSWQESGWQMGVVSKADAVGAMQVLPSTARWMEHYAGRPLDLDELGDNATAGVLLLRVLAHHTDRRTHKIAAYYQGLGAVRRHGLYDETRAYVANVEAIKRRLEAGRAPS
ncbi:transglycosylase SLT domain-containing protein [Nocardioides sp. STR2]|uniref:Transglycosylase SLT domain-containing protein n=1 Tax=Nocardioides pini TaxID=2975053 RepID=A0ABT4CEV9_9ACTN|nr:transglycosylase SLT domain-containing protein [Nocardioides pini]MCY4727510.1 transglycosylase SLT domain-containing protein [Nocardioides pini]